MGLNQIQRDQTDVDFITLHNISTTWSMSDFHFHDVFEINLSLSGGNKFFVEDKVYPVQKGDLFVFNNQDLHKTVVPMKMAYERYLIFFRPEYIQELCTSTTDLLECFLNRGEDFCHRIHLSMEQLESLLPLFDRAITAEDQMGYGSDIHKRLLLAEILIKINQFYQSADILPIPRQDGDYEKIKPILLYIQQHLGEDLRLDHLADKFYMSKYHLCTIFKKVIGFTVNEYIINRRIMKARELLKQNISVSKVGDLVGFPNDAHFIRTFKKLVGTTPKQYGKRE